MKVSEFNKLPLEAKKEYIFRFVDSKAKPGVCSSIVFPLYTILIIASVGGDIISACIEQHDERAEADAMKALKGKEFIAYDLSHLPKIKEAIHKKIMRATNWDN
jgi:hypothetical protein